LIHHKYLNVILIQQLIKSAKAREVTAPKKSRNEELLDWVDAQWFRHTFVTTYMAFVGQTADPWDVPVKQSVAVLQMIWDATNNMEYEITMSTSVHQKVRDLQSLARMVLIYIPDRPTPCRLLAQRYWIRRHRRSPRVF